MHASADKAMAEVFDAVYASLHVRVSNRGAFHLYTQTLGYEYVSPSFLYPLHFACVPQDALLQLAMRLFFGFGILQDPGKPSVPASAAASTSYVVTSLY